MRYKVVVGDALHTQRGLSAQIVEAGGDYCWTVKDNQPSLREAIARFFEPEICTPGFGLSITDLQTISQINKGHGRTERRTLTTAGVWEGELDWPYTLHEDRTRVKIGQAPRVMAILNNLVLGLIARSGMKYVPEARRKFAAKPELALDLILQSVC